MVDKDYWKQKYKETWDSASAREDAILELIETETEKRVEKIGFGTGSTKYFPGSAADYGYKKGDADLQVIGTNLQLEVTGPLVKSVNQSEPLWIRPDKVENARSHVDTVETWVIHHPLAALLSV